MYSYSVQFDCKDHAESHDIIVHSELDMSAFVAQFDETIAGHENCELKIMDIDEALKQLTEE